MKKGILLMAFSVITFFGANAQVNPHAIGVRLGGDNFGRGAELSYQHGLGDANRLELDLGASIDNSGFYKATSLGISGIYHWVWNITSGLNWYAGLGGQLGYYSYGDSFSENDGITLAAGGQIGIEFDFNELGAPILLSLDTRPMWGFLNTGNSGFGYGAALGIRYIF